MRFISFEPLIEDLGRIDLSGIAWAIVGGESGVGARSTDMSWAYSILSQAAEQGCDQWMKQLGVRPTIFGVEMLGKVCSD